MRDGVDDNIADDNALQSSLMRAAAEKLGTSMASTIKDQDRELFTAGSNAMADAIREAKEQLTKRKAEVGEAAALSELDASIRSEAAGVEARGILKARPKLWLLDRDGCLNEDVGAPGVVRSDDLRLIPGSAGAVRRLRLSAKVAIITNQSARGKGLLSAEELDAIHEELRHQLATTARGGLASDDGSQWDGLYVCEDAGASERKKPQPGMILEALREFGCQPSEAVMIGDSWSDVVAAQRAGCVGVLLTTGHGASLGALLREEGVKLPVTLTVESAAPAGTDFVQLQRTLAREQNGGGAANALEAWIAQRGGAEATLIWEALRQDVRVYADLAQAEGELVAMASAMAG